LIVALTRHWQFSVHDTPAWKHSQYFFKHPVLRQWHPQCVLVLFGRKALGLRLRIALMAFLRIGACS